MYKREKGSSLPGLFSILVMDLLLVPALHAQVTGATLSGTVTDPSGRGIPSANVVIKNLATDVTREISTDNAGFYSAPNLLPGRYDVSVSAPGFSTQVQTGLTLTVGAQQLLNVSLQIGGLAEKVQVASTAPDVQLTNSTISAEVNATTVRELPLNGRDWTQLATLQPGVTNVRTQAAANSTANRGSRGFGQELSDSGHRSVENNYRVNGISVNDYTNSAPGSPLGINLGVDGIQEFSVVTTNYSADYGRTSGAVINAITKSGTNTFHGSAFWFLRDEDFDARNFFDPAQIPPFHRNQFGASGGGAIKKDKTFIFGDYEGIRQDLGLSFRDTVPSQDLRNGILHNPDGTTSAITIDPKVAPFLALWPLPNAGLVAPGNTGVLLTSGQSRGTENYVTTRVDQKFSDKDTVFGSYFFDSSPLTIPDALVDILNYAYTRRQMASVEETHVFSPALANSFRVGLNRSVGLLANPYSVINPLVKDPSLGFGGQYAPIIMVPSLTTMQAGWGAQSIKNYHSTSGQLYDDAFLTSGTHSLKFGFAFERLRSNNLSLVYSDGVYTFPSLQGFLQNQPTNVKVRGTGLSGEVGMRQSIFGGYLQDDWRWRSNLTLNLGVRYEMATLPTEAHDRFLTVLSVYGGAAVPTKTAFLTNPTLRNFEPRVGFSWDPFKNGRTAVRGSFGIFDVLPLVYQMVGNYSASYPFVTTLSATLTGQPPGSAFPTPPASLLTFNPNSLAGVTVKQNEPNPHRNYAMNWNLNIQRDLGWNTSLLVGYVGSRTVHASFSQNDGNGVLGTPTSAGYLWPYPVGSGAVVDPNAGQIHTNYWDADAYYEGLQTKLTKRMSRGVQYQAAYTWSRCIDTGSAGAYPDFFTNSVPTILSYNRQHRRGNCDFDIRHVFVFNTIWNLPTPHFAGALGAHTLGGWQLGGIVSASTGTPFSLNIAGDPLGQKNAAPAADYPSRLNISGCGSVINPGNVNSYLKLNCFSPPVAPASFAAVCQPAAPSVAAVIPNTCMNLMGNGGRNQIFGPGLSDVDFSVFKNIPVRRISESFNAQLRFEFFNILNHANFQSPLDNSTLFNTNGTPVSGAGAIDATTTTSRQIQFGLKVIW